MKLTEDQIRRIARQEASKSTRSGGGVGGGISASWVEENYISKAFFNRIFEIYGPGEHSGDPDVQVEPNDTDTTISNIKALVGFWTEEYVSALGLSDGGSGGGSSALYNMLDVKPNSDASPTRVYGLNGTASDNGKVLAYSTTYGKWIAQTVQSGGGSVTSITPGTGLTTSPSGSITSTGTISISAEFQTYISHGESAYNALDNYLLKTAGVTAIVVGSGANADKIGVTINGSNTGFITVPFASKAAQLSTARTIWGQSFDGSAAVKGDITQATCLEFSEIGGSAGHGGYIDFHYNGSTSDYTSRIIEDASGVLKINNTIFAKLSGNVSIGTSTISSDYKLNVAGYTKTTRLYLSDSVYLEYDSDNGGVYLYGAGFYTDSYISALGLSSGGGGFADYIPLSGSNNITGNLVPATDGACNLGSSAKKWGSIYCYSITGNASLSMQSVSCTYSTISNNVAIGSSIYTSYKLYVNGTSNFTDDLTVRNLTITHSVLNTVSCVTLQTSHSYGIYLKGATGLSIFGSGSYQNVSDIRLKNIVSYIDKDVNDIANAPIFNFTFKDAKVQNVMLGTSAQYWMTVLPNAVTVAPNNYLSMDYGSTALAAAVLTARKVINHEERIAALELENKKLREEVERLKAA